MNNQSFVLLNVEVKEAQSTRCRKPALSEIIFTAETNSHYNTLTVSFGQDVKGCEKM